MKRLITALTIANLVLVARSRGDDVSTQHALTADGARKIAETAARYARSHGAGGHIAVVDAGGHLVHFVRLDGSFPAGANVSIGKARTAATFRRPTKVFEDSINQGRFTMTALPDFTPLQGGVPIVHEGQVIGAIGVSGAASAQQDEELAIAGANALATNSANAR